MGKHIDISFRDDELDTIWEALTLRAQLCALDPEMLEQARAAAKEVSDQFGKVHPACLR